MNISVKDIMLNIITPLRIPPFPLLVLALLSDAFLQYASLRGSYALLDSPSPSLPLAALHHVLWVRERLGVGTRAPGADDQRLHRVDDSALSGDTVQDALCRAVYRGC